VGEAAVEVVLVGPVLQVADPQSTYLLQVRRLVVRRCHLAARRRGAARGPEARRTWVRPGRSSPAAASRSFSASRNLVRFSFCPEKQFCVLVGLLDPLWALALYSLHGRGAVRGGVTARGQHSISAHMQKNMYLVMSLGA
jgi:hypothetical protein